MMSVYISQDGYCSTNQAEASEHGSFEKHDTPKTKSNWVKFINTAFYAGSEQSKTAHNDFDQKTWEAGQGARKSVSEDECAQRIEAAIRNRQSDFNISAEEQIQNGSFDDACRLMEQCLGRINEHIRQAKKGAQDGS